MSNQKSKKPSPPTNGQKSHHRPSLPSQIKKVASPGMFLLQRKFGAENHTPEWKRKLEHLYCSRFGDLGKSIKAGAYYTIVDPPRPEISVLGSPENLAAVAANDLFFFFFLNSILIIIFKM